MPSTSSDEVYLSAYELRQNGKFSEAISLLKSILTDVPDHPSALADLCYCFILIDELDEARFYHERAKKIDESAASVGWNEARLLLKTKNIDMAISVARETNIRFPDDTEGMGVLGSCLCMGNHTEEGLLFLDKAIDLNPNFAEALISRGLVRFKQKDKVEALTDLEKAHRLKPHVKQIWDLIVHIKLERKEYSELISILNLMIQIDPDNEKVF